MARKRHKAEENVTTLWRVDVMAAHGVPLAEATRSIGVSELRP